MKTHTHTHTHKQNLSLQCSHSFLFTVSSVLYPWGKRSSGGLNPWNENICSILPHHVDVYLFVNYIPNIFKVESCRSLMVFLKCSLHFIWFFILQLLFLAKKVCCCSVTKSCPTLCDLTDWSMPGFPVPPLSPGVYSSSFPLSRWCYLTILSFAAFLSFLLVI